MRIPSPEHDIIWLLEVNGMNLALKIFALCAVWSLKGCADVHGLLKEKFKI